MEELLRVAQVDDSEYMNHVYENRYRYWLVNILRNLLYNINIEKQNSLK